MILVDANLLIYAFVTQVPQHEAARGWLDARLSGRARLGLPWESLLAFMRIVTNPRVVERPEPIAGAWGQVQAWLNAPPAWIPASTERHRDVLARLMPAVSRANLIPDAHLAALAIEHGLELATADAGFARFPGLHWQNPLLAK